MTGAEITATVIEAARFAGFRVTHFRPARTQHGWKTPLQGDKGFPDVVIARAGKSLALEVKGIGDRLRPGQAEWLDALGGPTGGDVTAGIVTGVELDPVLAYLVGRASGDELRACLSERWARAVRP